MARPAVPWQHLQNTVEGEPVYDALGREVRVGDLIAIGIRIGDTGALRIGTVTGFGRRKGSVSPRVKANEPEFEDSRTRVQDPRYPNSPYATIPVYRPKQTEYLVTVLIEYSEEQVAGQGWSSPKKGYTEAYNRRFVVVDS